MWSFISLAIGFLPLSFSSSSTSFPIAHPTGLRFQCCNGKYIDFSRWKSWSRCSDFEDRRVNFHGCPRPDVAPSHFSFVTICIIVTVVVLVFGLAFVIFKRIRYHRRSPRAAPPTVASGRPSHSSSSTRTSTSSDRRRGDDRRPPSVSGDDLAPPSYEEAILLTNRPPAFDKLT